VQANKQFHISGTSIAGAPVGRYLSVMIAVCAVDGPARTEALCAPKLVGDFGHWRLWGSRIR
jgi:hypothetical protein